MLRELHWLPVQQRINYKLACFVHRCLQGQCPGYLNTMCQPLTLKAGRGQLRAAKRGELDIPSTKTVMFGPRSFRISGPTVWNNLIHDIPHPELLTFSAFKNRLKTVLFSKAYGTSMGSQPL